jgi:hypothetical protein
MSARASRHVHACAVAEGTRALPVVSARRLCQVCRERRPLFRHRGVVKADADHTLCFQCFRALREQVRAARQASGFWLPASGLPA